MKSKQNIYWTDMHSNLHHEKMTKLDEWYRHIKEIMDFWPIAYYPYYMRPTPSGWNVEDVHDMDKVQADWETLRKFVDHANRDGFPMFMGFEWQGSGHDGDHNVYFKDNRQDIAFPMRYTELYAKYKVVDAIAIPHHLAYQLGNRGKNWETHIDAFSPFVEIYSSHGSSENDTDALTMNRHIHMGPRTVVTAVQRGWDKGYTFGVIASGDNHSVPGVYEFGSMACLADDNTKEAIWDAMLKKRIYGVSQDRIRLDFSLNGQVMGGITTPHDKSDLHIDVVACDKIDRIEVIADNQTIEMIPNITKKPKYQNDEILRFKFKIEFGWGPDRRIFPDISSRVWQGKVNVAGRIVSIDKCWNNFGQQLFDVSDSSMAFTLTTYKNAHNDKWMGTSSVTTEGFILEIESKYGESIHILVDDHEYDIQIKEILEGSQIIDLQDDAQRLIQERYGFETYYRNDSWWHNSYKFKINQGSVDDEYTMDFHRVIDTTSMSNLRLRVWQRNGSVAWSSPVFIREGKL